MVMVWGVYLLFAPDQTSAAVPVLPQTQHKQHPREVSDALCWQSQACLSEGIPGMVCQALVPFSPCMNTVDCQGCQYVRKGVLL